MRTVVGMGNVVKVQFSPLWREQVGQALRALRNEREERLTDVSDAAGISPQYLSEVERGMKDPSSEILEAIAGALGSDVAGIMRLAYPVIEHAAADTSTDIGIDSPTVSVLALVA